MTLAFEAWTEKAGIAVGVRCQYMHTSPGFRVTFSVVGELESSRTGGRLPQEVSFQGQTLNDRYLSL
jgi:hypothetical protein